MTGNSNTIGNPIVEHVSVTEGDDEGRVAIPLSPEDALRGLLQVPYQPHSAARE